MENLDILSESSKAFDPFRTKLTAFVYPSEHKANGTRLKTDDGIIGHHDEDIGVKVPTQNENQGDDDENVLERLTKGRLGGTSFQCCF
jgi:hypothetical protein